MTTVFDLFATPDRADDRPDPHPEDATDLRIGAD